jgi:protein SCO1/2
MTLFQIRKPAIALLSMLLAVSAAAQQSDHDHHQPPRYARELASYTAPDVTLLDANGEKRSLRSLLDHDGPVLLQFIFTTCPTICPVMSEIFSAAQEKFGPDVERVRMISITIDPDQDTPARMKEYARQLRARHQWIFLTGAADDILAVQIAFDIYRGNKMRHEPVTFLRASFDQRWARINGLMSAADLMAEYRRLISK